MPRLDTYLFENGFAASRSLAAKLVKGGYVTLNGDVCRKPGTPVEEGADLQICESPLTRYVSRGGLKLEAALNAWGVLTPDMVCADIGASTGGFTDCLLQHGAGKVFAIDSGSGQLHSALRENRNVVSLENVNARFLDEGMIGKVDLVVMDVSFISQTLLYPAVTKVLKKGGYFISLVKPQFEVGRENVGSGGIVRSEKARKDCLDVIAVKSEKYGLVLKDVIPSPITGGDGNTEYLALFFYP
ncbi:MAG: TlyA family RNA methyltransferase [Clostridia bacterium]|nr:TlyA family RNA methyltransferase [Clostridia bacterium]